MHRLGPLLQHCFFKVIVMHCKVQKSGRLSETGNRLPISDDPTVKLVCPDPNLAVWASVDNSMLMIERHPVDLSLS